MADPSDLRRKRILYRSHRRGTREMDLLLGSFADRHVTEMSVGQLGRFEALLESSDPDLYDWITRREPVPREFDDDVMRLLQDFRLSLPNL